MNMKQRWRENGDSFSIFAFLMLLLTFIYWPERKRRLSCRAWQGLNLLAFLSLFVLGIYHHLLDMNHSGKIYILTSLSNRTNLIAILFRGKEGAAAAALGVKRALINANEER